MNSLVSKGSIAVVGDELFILGFKLAGVRRVFTIDLTLPEDVLKRRLAKIFNAIYNDPQINVVIIHESLKNIAERIRKALTHPLIVYIPDIRTAGRMDIKGYYHSLVKGYLGVAIELG